MAAQKPRPRNRTISGDDVEVGLDTLEPAGSYDRLFGWHKDA